MVVYNNFGKKQPEMGNLLDDITSAEVLKKVNFNQNVPEFQHNSNSNLIQQFSDFQFLNGTTNIELIKTDLIYEDIQLSRDHFLNDNIRSILSYANQIQSEDQYTRLFSIIKLLLKRRYHYSKQIIVIVKISLLFRKLIQISIKFPDDKAFILYRMLLDTTQNHFNSSYTNLLIIQQINNIQALYQSCQPQIFEQRYPFNNNLLINQNISALVHLYIGEMLKVNILQRLKKQLAQNLDILNRICQHISVDYLEKFISDEQLIEKVQKHIYYLQKETSFSNKQQIQLILKYADEIISRWNKNFKKRIVELEFYIAVQFWKSSSMEKKIWTINLIVQKIKLFRTNYKDIGIQLKQFLLWIENNGIYNSLIKDNVHHEILSRSNQLLKFLYQNDAISQEELQDLINFTLKSESTATNKFAHNFIINLDYKDLLYVFNLINEKFLCQKFLCQTSICVIQSIVNAHCLDKKTDKKKKNLAGMKRQQKKKGKMKDQQNLFEQEQIEKMEQIQQIIKHKPLEIIEKLFNFILENLNQYPLINILVKLVSIQPLIFTHIPQYIINALREDKASSINLLDSIIKMPFPIPKQKGSWNRYQVVSWLVDAGVFQYLLAGIAKNRFEKNLNQRLNLMILLARYYKPFEKTHIELLWKILVKCKQEKHRQQFFIFIKDCLTRGNDHFLFTQEAVNFLYFEILLKLHSDWFSLKIYQCFQMFFMRLNQDCKLITYSINTTVNNIIIYQLIDPQLIGFNKFWYIYFNSDDLKVVKKCKDFLCRVIGKFECEEKIFNLLKDQYVKIIIDQLQKSIETINKKLSKQKENKKQISEIARCLEIIIKIIDDVEGTKLDKQKQNVGEELTFNITTSGNEFLHPKKQTIKVNNSITLKNLKDIIGSKINPQKKGNQIKIMTRGQHQKGENLTLKQLKYQNKNTFIVQLNQNNKPEITISDQTLFENMKMFFPNYSQNLIRYVLHKRQGQTAQVIGEVFLDEQLMQKYRKQLPESVLPSKRISELLVSTSNIFETFFDILNLQNQQLSLLTWKIISNIPDNPYHTNLIKNTILKTNDWNQLFSFNESTLFKTLYNLQLLKTMIIGNINNNQQKQEQQQISTKFVENGGFQHLCKIMKIILCKWEGDSLQSKMLASLLQIIKVYLIPHLMASAKNPLSHIFKQVCNFKNHLKDLRSKEINQIITEIIPPQFTNTITSKSLKSFSFKGQSNSSNLTPTFQSPNSSGRNSPHSQTPNDNQDSLSLKSNTKSSNLPKKKKFDKKESYQVKLTKNQNMQVQLHQIINTQELTTYIIANLQKIIINDQLLQNEDILLMAEELFEILLPSILVNQSYKALYDQNIIKIILKGISEIKIEQFRLKFVYLTFLLCVIHDSQIYGKIVIEDDDQLFMVEQKIQKKVQIPPRLLFIKEFLPLFIQKPNLHQTYFICLTKLIKQVSNDQLESLMQPQYIVSEITKAIQSRPFIQQREAQVQDHTLNGLLAFLQIFLQKYKHMKSKYQQLVQVIINFLFYLPDKIQEIISVEGKNYPKCKRKNTRKRCFTLLVEMCNQCPKNQQILINFLSQYCHGINSKEYQNTNFKNQKYAGLKNLGSTCYINSLLQQLHKNTILPALLTNSSVISISQNHPLYQLAYLFSTLSHTLKNIINPIKVIKNIKFQGNEEINPLIQQDVNEFFMAFVQLLQRNNAKKLLQACVMGQICNQITGCEQDLKFIKKGYEQFYTITLDIKGKRNLMEALQYFIKGDVLDGDNMYYSEALNKKIKAIKRSYIKKLPNTLILTLKRFEFDYNEMIRYKLNDYFEFPIQLDLYKFSEQYLSEQGESSYDQSYYKYRLVGVLVHSGTAQSGHYYSFIKDQQKWYEFNDSVVTEFNINYLKSECFGGQESKQKNFHDWDTSKSKNAYLLFYQRIIPTEHQFSNIISDKQSKKISAEYQEIIWKENFQFLKSRLIYDFDFIKFLQNFNQYAQSPEIKDILNSIGREDAKKQEALVYGPQQYGQSIHFKTEQFIKQDDEQNRENLDFQKIDFGNTKGIVQQMNQEKQNLLNLLSNPNDDEDIGSKLD